MTTMMVRTSRLCIVCCKKMKHFSHNCPIPEACPTWCHCWPWLSDIFCKCRNQLGGHTGQNFVTFCACCMTLGQHPYVKCPYRPKDRLPLFVPRTVVMRSAMDRPPYEYPVPDVY
ncbi:hypothetical protein ACFX11_035748 [Malus domestica]